MKNKEFLVLPECAGRS